MWELLPGGQDKGAARLNSCESGKSSMGLGGGSGKAGGRCGRLCRASRISRGRGAVAGRCRIDEDEEEEADMEEDDEEEEDDEDMEGVGVGEVAGGGADTGGDETGGGLLTATQFRRSRRLVPRAMECKGSGCPTTRWEEEEEELGKGAAGCASPIPGPGLPL